MNKIKALQNYRDWAEFEPRTPAHNLRAKENSSQRSRWILYLTLYHTVPTFIDPGKEAFCGKGRKCW